MKKITTYTWLALLVALLVSCEQQYKVDSPEIISFTYEEPAYARERISFEIEAHGDNAVIWSGTEGSDYDMHLASPDGDNIGEPVNLEYDKLEGVDKGSIRFLYDEPGTYKAVLIITNYGYQGDVIETAIKELEVSVLPSASADILEFEIEEADGDPVFEGDSILITVRDGTDVSSLVPEIEISDSATISPASGVAQDFTSPVIYTVTAEDGTTSKDWTVIVSTLDAEAETDIVEFELDEAFGDIVIDASAHTVDFDVRFGTDITALSPSVTVSDWATVNPASGDPVDFTNPVTYTVTAEDGVTTQDWTVTSNVLAPETSTDITGFTIEEQVGEAIINAVYHTVAIAMPNGTDVSALEPVITVSDYASVNPASEEAVDFTNTVSYTVTAEDGTTTQDWMVTVTLVPVEE